jgi:hypothetical protein
MRIKTKTKRVTMVKIEMSQKEAVWLRELLQVVDNYGVERIMQEGGYKTLDVTRAHKIVKELYNLLHKEIMTA